MFEHYQVFYPCIYLPQSVLWIRNTEFKLRQQLGFSITDIFKPLPELEREYISKHTSDEWHTEEEARGIEIIFESLKRKATGVDPTLTAASEAVLTKMKYQLSVLEQKMLRAEKKKMQTQLLRIRKLKNTLFPGGTLQERVENFSEYYLEFGATYFDIIKDGIKPIEPGFMLIERRT